MAYGAGLNTVRATALDLLIISGRFDTTGTAGAVEAEKGVGWEVTKGVNDDGKYKITLDEPVSDILYAHATLLDTDHDLEIHLDLLSGQDITFILQDDTDAGDAGDLEVPNDVTIAAADPVVMFVIIARRQKHERR